MVRETRHLWIGNLPENVREEQILELFQRHGRVQSVKLLCEETSSSNLNPSGNGVRLANGSGQRATVSFIDIRSASKALRAGPTLSGQTLQIAYHEPGSVPCSRGNSVTVECNSSPARSIGGDSSSSVTVNSEISVGSGSNNNTPSANQQPSPGNPILGHSTTTTTNGPSSVNTNSYNNRQPRFPPQHGQSEDSSSHFYEQPKGFSRGGRGEDHFHGGRGRRENRYLNNRQGFNPDRERRYRNNWYSNENRFAPPEAPENERTSSAPPLSNNNNEPGTNNKGPRLPDSPASSVSSRHLPSKRHQSRSVSESGSSDRGSSGGSRSRSGSRSSVSTSASSGRSRSPPHHGSAPGQFPRGGGGGGSSTGRFHQNSFARQRSLGEDESVNPSRTVFVTGLDSSITGIELRKTFEQYGDIVDAKVRKLSVEGSTASGIVEFVDIASAIRAQWVRHVLKSRDTRISFYRNVVTNSLILDGVPGVTEKQISGHCCQFGAISRVVMDSERILALVQFEEISSAQTAFRELKNWIQKGRQLHVDFASPACIRLFLDRALGTTGNNLSLSPDLRSDSATPPLLSGNTTAPTKSRRSGNRKFSEFSGDRRISYRHNEPGLEEGKSEVSYETGSKNNAMIQSNGPSYDVESFNGKRNLRYNGSPSIPGNGDELEKQSTGGLTPTLLERRSGRVNNSSCSSKIDLSCHETDSAVVTSSSDIICVEESIETNSHSYTNHPHNHHGGTSTLVMVNGDDHQHSSYESVGAIKSRASYRWTSKSQNVFDGVSSTSPEPKTETVHKVSPDSGIGIGSLVTVERVPPTTTLETIISPVLLDPRTKALENKIRRSSADSGNLNPSAFVPVNSNSGITSIYSSETIPDTPGDDSDDRPGTPLCDENPEHFLTVIDNEPQSKHPASLAARSVLPSPKTSDQALSLPLPGFALHRTNLGNSSPRQRNSRLGSSSSSPNQTQGSLTPASQSPTPTTTLLVSSPLSSPTPTPSVMTSAGVNEKNSLPLVPSVHNKSSISSPPTAKSTNVADNTNEGQNDVQKVIGNDRRLDLDEIESSVSPSAAEDVNPQESNQELLEMNLRKDSPEEEKLAVTDDEVLVSPPSSDFEGSPRGEEEGDGDLAQRVQSLYQRFDEWDSGNRSVGRTLSYASTNSTDDASECSRLSLHFDKPWLSRSKAIDLDELRQQPSDITKSLIAKKSIFDEDIKRLESLNDTTTLNGPSLANWRLNFTTRSSSMTSNSSNTSVPHTPNSASSSTSSNVFPSTPSTGQRPHHNSFSCSHQSSNSSLSKSSGLGIQLKFQTSSPSVGPLPNSVIRRKDSAPVGNNVSHWGSKDPRLCPKPTVQSGHMPSKIPTSSSSSSSHSSPHSVSIHRSVSVNANLLVGVKPENKKHTNVEFLKAKHPGEIVIGSDEPQKPILTTQKSAPTPGIHQGIPRMVERSVSLDSKKGLQTPTPLLPTTVAPTTPTTPTNPCNSIPATMGTSNTSLGSRRTSVDSYSQKEVNSSSQNLKKEGDHQTSKVKSHETKESKSKEIVTKPTPSLTIISSHTTNSVDSGNLKGIGKFDPSNKEESRLGMHHIQQATTVAVVATTQLSQPHHVSTVLTSKTSSNSTGKESNKDKESNRKKSKSSNSSNGTATPVSKESSSSGAPSKGDSSSSSKFIKERKEKSSSSSSSSGGTNNSKEKHEHENTHHGHHHKEKKKEKDGPVKEKESTANETGNTVNPPSVPSSISHGHKKELKETKTKRRLSTVENEPELKKVKLEKEKVQEKEKEVSLQQRENSHHHRTKSTSTTGALERRESRDSSSSANKEKLQKEKSSNSLKGQIKGEPASSPLPPPVKEKTEKGHKDSHHRSKSTSSNSSRNHYHEKSEKATSQKDRDKDKQKKEKLSPSGNSGKDRENNSSKSSSKHSSTHSHSSSSHHRKTEKDEKDVSKGSPSTSSKSKSREKEREKLKISSSHFESDEVDDVDGIQVEKTKEKAKSSGKEKRDSILSTGSKTKRERQKSGGDSSSAPGGGTDSGKGISTSRNKNKEQKRRRARVIDTDSSTDDDEDERRKHHSIFDVVVDEYVSMYDKVKARSNRACKNVGSKQQQEEIQKKQDRVQDSFQQLKKSRAKREEKKRSTSIDERKSFQNSSDEESQNEQDSTHPSDFGIEQPKLSSSTPRASLSIITGLCSSSEEEEKVSLGKKQKPSHPPKPKNKSSRDGSSKSSSKKKKKTNKASPLRSSAYFLSHSDEDSGPSLKKSKLSSKHNTPSLTVLSNVSEDRNKFSEEGSTSEPEPVPRTPSPTPPKSSKKKRSSLNPERKSIMDIYTESDTSLQSFKDARKPTSSKQKKEKSSKQKSMRHIFESSDSSGDEDSGKVVLFPLKKEKESSGKSKTPKESKNNKKKFSHHGHGTSSGSRSGKRKRESLNAGDSSGSKNVSSSGDGKKNQPTMEDLLFGPMSNSGSEADEPSSNSTNNLNISTNEERPATPNPIITSSTKPKQTSPQVGDTPLLFSSSLKKSSKSDPNRNKQRRSSSVHESSKSVDESSSSRINSSSNTGKSNSEKRKKKHHKRSKRVESRELKTEHSVDINSLFSTPLSSPAHEGSTITLSGTSPAKFTMYASLPVEMPSILNIQKSSPILIPAQEDKEEKSMFSSDEDDDDKLKIDISEAIISASGGNEDEDEEPLRITIKPEIILPLEPLIDEVALAAAKLFEEEEKKRNSLVEQDKAIESILMERKSPPRTPIGLIGSLGQCQVTSGLDSDYLKQDDLLKDETAISQEETEDAVAALLKNLGNEDDVEVDETLDKSSASPPTIRILEDSPSPSSALSYSVNSSGVENEKDLLVRSTWYSPPKSPKELQIDENEISAVIIRDRQVDETATPRKKKLTCEEASLELHEVLEQAKQAVADSRKQEEGMLTIGIKKGEELVKVVSRRVSNETSDLSVTLVPTNGDVYEFHDSDDEGQKSAPTQPQPQPSSSSISPQGISQGLHTIPKPVTPPRTKSPAVSTGLLEIAIEKLPLMIPPPQQQQLGNHLQQFSPRHNVNISHHIPTQHLLPISIEVQQTGQVHMDPLTHSNHSPPRATPIPVQIVPTVPLLPLVTPNKILPVPLPSCLPRSSIDDTIEDVIRNFKVADIPESELVYHLPLNPASRASPKGKGRSASKDSDDSPSGKNNGRVCSPSRRGSNHALPIIEHQQNTPHQKLLHPLPLIETRTDSHAPPPSEAFLIDPQSGVMMMRQTEEGPYAPVSGQEALGKSHIQLQPQTQHLFQSAHGVTQKAEVERAGSLERIIPDQQPYQIQKNEGLPALLAQQQQHSLQHHQISESHRKQQQVGGLTPPTTFQSRGSFSSTGSSPPVSSPSFIFGPLKQNPTTQSSVVSLAGRPQGIYGNVPTSTGYTPVALIRPQQDSPPGTRPIRHQGPLAQHVPSPAQIQAQLVRIPQVPIATTITKVDTRNEELQRKPTSTQPQSTVILTTTSSGSMGLVGLPVGLRLPAQHHLQARVHEGFGSQGPPRIDISGNAVQASAGSPKAGRVPQQHEPNTPQSTQHRIQQHIPFDSAMGDVRVVGRVPGLETQYLSGLPHGGSPYMPYSMPGGGNLPPGQHPYGIRPGSVDPLKQQQDLPKALERPSTAHIVPQHLSSPHLGERGSAESPHLVANSIYGSRHPIYGSNGHLGIPPQHHSPIPSAHQHQRQTFTHPFEFDEGRVYSRSPSYPVQSHDGTPAVREGSPFAMVPNTGRRETPPPAHGIGRYPPHQVLPLAEAPTSNDRHRLVQVLTPPHGSQVPPQGDSLLMLLQRYPIVWHGLLGLKNENAACQFHFVSGNMNVATDSLPANADGTNLPLRISQRMRLEQTQLDGVARKLQTEQEHCMLLALPCGRDHLDVLQQSNNLRNGFITYLQLKQAAGIVNVHQSSGDTPSFVIHIFPACDFANENLARISPDLLHGVADIAHLLIVIATV